MSSADAVRMIGKEFFFFSFLPSFPDYSIFRTALILCLNKVESFLFHTVKSTAEKSVFCDQKKKVVNVHRCKWILLFLEGGP